MMLSAAPFIPYIAVAVGMLGFHNALAALGIYHAGMLAVVIFSKKHPVTEQRPGIDVACILLVTLVFTLGGVLFYILWPYLDSDSRTIADKLAGYGINRHNWPYFAVYFSIVNAILEELFWRGSLGSDNPYPVVNDFLFGGYHVFVLLFFMGPLWSIPVFIVTTFAGWLWRMLRLRSGGLAVPIITHIAADVSIAIAVHIRAFA